MSHINKIKTSNGQEYDVQDKRIIEVTPADVGKVLTVEEDGSLAFKNPAGGGTKLYRHSVHDTNRRFNGSWIDNDATTPNNASELMLRIGGSNIVKCNILSYGPNTDFIAYYVSYNGTEIIYTNSPQTSFDDLIFDTVTEI